MKQNQFINEFRVTMTLANTKQPEWSSGVHNHYKVRIAKDGKTFSFDFFSSTEDAERGEHPTIKDALYCFASDVFLGKLSHKDFCDEMGCSTDSIRDLKAWKLCVKFAKNAERLRITDTILEEWMSGMI